MEDKPRYWQISNLLDLMMLMMEKTHGVSLNDIMNRYHVSRRTSERMRDCLMLGVPQIEEIENPNSREKRWGFPPNVSMREIINFTPEELANLEHLKKYQEQNGFEDKEKLLEKTINNIRAFSRKRITELDNALEILLQTEGFAVKQMPKHKIDMGMLETVRKALKERRKIWCKYNGKDKRLAPYGLIYGEKVYLIGVEDNTTNPYCYLLHRFSDVKITMEGYDKGDFDLNTFAKKSFGVYQGEAVDVKLLFSENVSKDVLNYHFHNTQKVKQNEDGTVTVKFKASGEYEIMWHLFKWGADVKILAPTKLKKMYIELLQRTLDKQKEK